MESEGDAMEDPEDDSRFARNLGRVQDKKVGLECCGVGRANRHVSIWCIVN